MDSTTETQDVETGKKRKYKNPSEKPNKKTRSIDNSKISKADLYKPPTAEELNRLRETEILFNSNLFRLQTEELLKEVSFKEKRFKAINEWFDKFRSIVNQIQECEFNIRDLGCVLNEPASQKLSKKLRNVLKNIPIDIKTDVDSNFKVLKPISVEITGLYNVKAVLKPNIAVNVNVIIPKNCFHEKDYLNYRYITKRMLYLAYLTTELKNHTDLISEIRYNYLKGNRLIPIMEIIPKDIKNTIVEIRIIPEENTFKLTRFEPNKNNIKPVYYNVVNNESITDEFSTSIYNSIVANDLTICENDRFRTDLVRDLKGACEAIVLLNIWLGQRRVYDGYGGFNEDLLYSLVAFLIKNGKINKHMSSYQVVRNVWTYLGSSNWESCGISLCDSFTDVELFHEYYKVVFVDRTGKYNLAADLDLNVYKKIIHEANLAVMYLDDGKFNSFQALFITKMPFYLQYDAVINVLPDKKLEKLFNDLESKQKIDCMYFKTPVIRNYIIEKLKQGLSDRITFVTPSISKSRTRKIDESPENDEETITIGINFNYFTLHKVVEKGPPTYDPEAEAFREFWGERSELRRFKDGTITEAVYWELENIQDKRMIFKDIINFVLETKLNLKNFNIVSDQFDYIMKLYPYTGVEEGNLKVINTFDELGKLLRSMKLPLDITAIQGISESFSYSDAFPPAQLNYVGGKKITFNKNDNILLQENQLLGMVPRYVCPIEGILQMAQHSKWPNDYEALTKLKTAFYIEISNILKKEENIKSNPKPDYIDILYNGFVFRLSIFHSKQIIELKKQIDETGVVSYEDNSESIAQEQKYVLLPKLIGALNGLHSQYPSYGPSTALIKRWFNSQLIDDHHFPNIVVNLLNASLYLNSAPFSRPAFPQLAFIRFLNVLATTDWNLQPVVLNFNNEITREQLDEHESRFQRNRDHFPALFFITAYDDFKSTITKLKPTTAVLNRLRILSIESMNVIEKNVNSKSLFDTVVFFKPNLIGYNVLIYLKPLLNPRRHQALEEKNIVNVKTYEKNDEDKIPVVDFNPVDLYLKELRDNYDEYALFFHDNYGGNVIGVLWKPVVHEEQEFKIANIAGKMLTSNQTLKVNLEAIVEDFYILGDGLVRTIETK